MPASPGLSADSAASGHGRRRGMHPCAQPLAFWSLWFVLPLVVAGLTKSPAWILLCVPSLPSVTLLGARLVDGHPTVGIEETERLDQMLIEVGGVDAFGVVAQDQTDMPITLRRSARPLI